MAGFKEKVASGAIWVTLEKFATQVVGFVVGMVLARLLTPTDYGIVAMLSIFFAIAGSLTTCGFGNALVQKKDISELEFNSVFYLSVIASLIVYTILYIAAPYIAEFYHTPVLCLVTRVSSISFILNAVNSVQGAELTRKMLFNVRFRISLMVSVVSSIVGISLAFMGFGVWAIVLSSLSATITSVIAYWIIIAWRPRLMFSFSAAKPLFIYGWKLSLSGLLHTIYMNLYGFLVGKFYTPADLAFVNKGNSIPNLVMNSVDGTIIGVSFPALAQLQDDKKRVVDAMKRMILCSTFLVIPLMILTAVCAHQLVFIIFGSQWDGAVVYVVMYCFSYVVWPFNSIDTATISAIGRSDVYLMIEFIKKTIGIVLMLFSIQYGVFVFMIVMCLTMSPLCFVINSYATGKLLGYNMIKQIKDVLPSCLCGTLMFLVVWCAQQVLESVFGHSVTSIIICLIESTLLFALGFVVYFILAKIFKVKALQEYLSIVLPLLKSKLPIAAHILEKLA